MLRAWGEGAGVEWELGGASPTPLHLAALLDDGGAMADALTGVSGGMRWGGGGGGGLTFASAPNAITSR